jgi:hypothetical protein
MRRDSGTFAAQHKVSVVIGECFGRGGLMTKLNGA